MSNMSLSAIASLSMLKSYNPINFLLSTEESFEMFPRHNGVATISKSFALNLIISVSLTN